MLATFNNNQGQIQDFHWGGGGAKDYAPGSRAHLRALEALGFFMLSCAI